MVGGDQADLVRLAEDLTFCKKKILKLICLDFWWETYTGTFILPDLFEIAVEYDVPLAGGVDGLQHGTGGKKKTKKNFRTLLGDGEVFFFHTGNPSCAGLAARARSCSRRRSGGTLLFPAREKGKRFFVSISNCFDVSCHSGEACTDFPCRHQFVSLFTCSLIRESSSS